jgi:hypothetical protein
MDRFFVSLYTDGPATRWNVIYRQTQEIVRRFASEDEAKNYAKEKCGGGPPFNKIGGA